MAASAALTVQVPKRARNDVQFAISGSSIGHVIVARLVFRALGVAAIVWAAAGTVAAAQQKPAEFQVKAVYLLNFGRFATWPSATGGAAQPFTVCVLGRDPFGKALDTAIAGERINGAPVVAQRIDRVDDADACRVLFVSASEQSRWPQILRALDDAKTLTVSDMPQFVDGQGMIQFLTEGNRVRFSVNVAAAERVGLTLGSELLRVAVHVSRDGKPAGARP